MSPLDSRNFTLSPDVVYRFNTTFEKEYLGEFNVDGKRNEFKSAIYFSGSDRAFIHSSMTPEERQNKNMTGQIENRFMRTDFPEGCVGHDQCGLQTLVRFDERKSNLTSDEDLWFTYAFRTGPEFEFVKGGVLPGFCGGGGDRCMTQCGKTVSPGTGWSVRMSWDKNGHLYAHLFYIGKTENCGQEFKLKYLDTKEAPVLRPGVWQTVEFHIVLDKGGEANGKLEMFVDKRKCIVLDEILFRKDDGRNYVDKVYVSMFHGGDTPDYAPDQYTYIDYDAFFMTDQKLLEEVVNPPLPFLESLSYLPSEYFVAAAGGFLVLIAGTVVSVRLNSTRSANKLLKKGASGDFGVTAPPGFQSGSHAPSRFATKMDLFEGVPSPPLAEVVPVPPVQQPPPPMPVVVQQAPVPAQQVVQEVPAAPAAVVSPVSSGATTPTKGLTPVPTAFVQATAAASRAFDPMSPSAVLEAENAKKEKKLAELKAKQEQAKLMAQKAAQQQPGESNTPGPDQLQKPKPKPVGLLPSNTTATTRTKTLDSYVANVLAISKRVEPRQMDSYTANMLDITSQRRDRARTNPSTVAGFSRSQASSRATSTRSRSVTAGRLRAKQNITRK